MNFKVPANWIACTLGDVASVKNGFAFKSSGFSDNGIPVIRISDINGNVVSFENSVKTTPSEQYDNFKIEYGDILIAMSGATTGKFGIYNEIGIAYQNQRVGNIRPLNTNLNKSFLFYYIFNAKRQIEKEAYGGAQPNISSGKIEQLEFFLPPLNEQKLIVAKIEELFSELDSGIASLKTARDQLKIYRQALLKHAFEGKLTEQWRKDNADKLETPEQLLACIQTERENRYQQQLNDWKQAVKDWEVKGKKGKKPQNPIKPKTHKKLSSDEVVQLDDLPHDWCWIRIGDISTVGTGVTPLKSNSLFYGNGDIPWVTSGALNQAFITKPTDLVTTKAFNETSLRLYPKNTLVVALYGEGKTRGKCSELLIEATTNQAIAAIILEGKSAGLRRFLKWFLTKNYEEMRLTASGGVQPNLNLGIIERMAIPMCTIAEAEELSSILDEKFSQIDKVDAEITEQLRKAEVLRQSILKKAFSGQLVPQDPNDEPAGELLARIKAGK